MKNLITLLFLVLCFFYSFAQSETYVKKPESLDGTKIKWTLTLKEDGTFFYNFYRDIVGEFNLEENFYGKGTWKAEKSLIFFYTNKETDLNETYTVDFTNSKARYTTKSPRDTSGKVVKTSLRFYESDNTFIKGLELFKE